MHIRKQLKQGALFQFDTLAQSEKVQHAILVSELLAESDSSRLRGVCSISEAFNQIRRCDIIWKNEEHEAVVYFEIRFPNRGYLKIRQSNEFSPRFWSHGMPIVQVITD